MLHGEGLPAPQPPATWGEESVDDDEATSPTQEASEPECEDATYVRDDSVPHLIEQAELNDLVHDLKLSKQHSQLLGSCLQQWNLLARGTKISIFRKHHERLSQFFKLEEGLCACFDVPGLMKEIGFEYNPSEWCLFIDSLKISLKAVLLHNGCKNPSIPLAHAVDMKETYETMSQILQSIRYDVHSWHICGDLKVIGFLGMQGEFTKYCCFLCLWDSCATQQHYKKMHWPKRETFVPGEMNIKNCPSVNCEKSYYHPCILSWV